MTVEAPDIIPELPRQPQYARFAPRLRAMVVDWIVIVVVLAGAVLLSSVVGSGTLSRGLAFLFIVFIILYEPVLVSSTGGTIGHHTANIRVVDDHTVGNVSLAKAFGRAVLKFILGWISFVVMLATRRNQAIHDLMTESTVQISNPAEARPQDFITERTEFSSPGMPSRLRRATVTCIYLVLMTIVYFAGTILVVTLSGVSDACLDNDVCTTGENLLFGAIWAVFLVVIAVCIGFGWGGRLPGARRTAPIPAG